tara:strand:+ start:151 stop:270 length:120 start_codon:yes stop_codon:yes gene_type:complete
MSAPSDNNKTMFFPESKYQNKNKIRNWARIRIYLFMSKT